MYVYQWLAIFRADPGFLYGKDTDWRSKDGNVLVRLKDRALMVIVTELT